MNPKKYSFKSMIQKTDTAYHRYG